jgi:hypothetical protein
MKVEPGDLIIDKKLNRTLTVLAVEKATFASISNYNVEYNLVSFMDSSQSQSTVNKVYEYELDAWVGIELIRASK